MPEPGWRRASKMFCHAIFLRIVGSAWMSDESNRELLDAWKRGDESAAAMLFHRYQRRLFALIRSRIARKLARRVDPEDVLMSAYRSFFVAVRKDRALAAADDDLWPLLL